MSLAPGTKLGPYEVLGPLGAGGMGEVFHARDPRLGRDVAIKALPEGFAQDPERLARFEREAKLLASLSHTNIAGIHGLELVEGQRYLVLEFVEGETLAARISRGPLPWAEAVDVCRQVAAGVEAAHDAGVVHRDLKPGNVMLRPDGTVKVLDFGLAKGGADRGASSSDPNLSASPTMTYAATSAGVILGTAAYMSPEQARGRSVDRRTDVWSFGCVLYECLTGRPVFEGETISDMVARILEREPDWSRLPASTPAWLQSLLRRCLTKDMKQRLQAIGEARIALERGGDGDVAAPTVAASRGPGRFAWAVSIVLLALLLALGAYVLRSKPPAAGDPVVSSILPPPGLAFDISSGPMALSPDGRQIAFLAQDSLGVSSIWLRSLDLLEPRMLAGTAGAQMVFWSPDGRDLGYFADSQLRRIGIAGGSSQAVTAAPSPNGGWWTRDGFIVFVGARGRGIQRVAATGGECASVLDTAGTPTARAPSWPVVLPDGRHFLFAYAGAMSSRGVEDGVYLAPLGGRGKPRLLLARATAAQYAEPGRLFFWREGALWEQAFDVQALRLVGAAVQVADHVLFDSWLGGAFFSVSGSGELAYLSGGRDAGLAELVWADREGRDLGPLAPPANYYSPRISHDGRRVAVDRSDPISGEGDIWIFDVARRLGDRFTSNSLNETSPVWSADDSRIFWMSAVGARVMGDIHVRSLDGTGAEETITHQDALTRPVDLSPDGGTLLFQTRDADISSQRSLKLLNLADHSEAPWASSSGSAANGRISRDGKWIAVVSDETGQDEVYVARFPQGGEKWRVSTAGGRGPSWTRDGHELVYYSADRYIMSVTFRAAAVPEIGTPVRLFRTQLREFFSESYFDVTADGQRLLLTRPVQGDVRASLTLVQGWKRPR